MTETSPLPHDRKAYEHALSEVTRTQEEHEASHKGWAASGRSVAECIRIMHKKAGIASRAENVPGRIISAAEQEAIQLNDELTLLLKEHKVDSPEVQQFMQEHLRAIEENPENKPS